MGIRLLLADDSITIQKVVGIIFSAEDYELTVVDNGDAALEKARHSRPDVMLVDALMPGMSGCEVCAAVRGDDHLAAVPILLMTGAFEPFDEDKSRQCGADDFISKPFESQQLIDKVKALAALGASRSAVPTPPSAAPVSEPPREQPSPDAATVVAAAAAVAATPSLEASFLDLGGSDTALEQPTSSRAGAPVQVDEVAVADDLWGAFELEDEVGGEAVEFGEVVAEDEAGEEVIDAAPFAVAGDEPFEGVAAPFLDQDAFDMHDTGDFVFGAEPAAAAVAPAVAVIREEPLSLVEEEVFAPTAEESFASLADAPFGTTTVGEAAATPIREVKPAPLGDAFDFAAISEEPLEVPEQQFAPEEEYVPVLEPPAAAAASGTITLTEEQLTAAISRISQEVIERIAWEVVPDLAESIIKEEIRRIKEGR